jgi:hypothetical protein
MMARQAKVIAPVQPPARYIQQVHKACGGEIVVVSQGQILALCCRKCEVIWNFESPFTLAVCNEFEDGVKRDADG